MLLSHRLFRADIEDLGKICGWLRLSNEADIFAIRHESSIMQFVIDK